MPHMFPLFLPRLHCDYIGSHCVNKKYLKNKNVILIFKVLVFKDILGKMSFFLYVISRFSFYKYFPFFICRSFFDLTNGQNSRIVDEIISYSYYGVNIILFSCFMASNKYQGFRKL